MKNSRTIIVNSFKRTLPGDESGEIALDIMNGELHEKEAEAISYDRPKAQFWRIRRADDSSAPQQGRA